MVGSLSSCRLTMDSALVMERYTAGHGTATARAGARQNPQAAAKSIKKGRLRVLLKELEICQNEMTMRMGSASTSASALILD